MSRLLILTSIYIKTENIKPFTYPSFTEIPKVKIILSDTRSMLLWKEQKVEILEYIDFLSEKERIEFKMPIKIVLREIERRTETLSNRSFFRKRALHCCKLA